MPNLLVRGIPDAVVRALKERAVQNGRSAEAEHRAILANALSGLRKRSFAEALAAMPAMGEDADFARETAEPPAPDVFA